MVYPGQTEPVVEDDGGDDDACYDDACATAGTVEECSGC
jgi:hypothetical protein